jgi:trimeric autotransporter adhesin
VLAALADGLQYFKTSKETTMKKRIQSILVTLALLLASRRQAAAQGTAFTYQGRLTDSGNPAQGNYDFRFKCFVDPFGNTQAGSTLLTNAVPVSNGLFTVTIDFGAGIFKGSNYWLEVDVRTNGASGYANLNPLQAITPAPYAIFAATASNLSGTLLTAQLSGTIANSNLPANPTFSSVNAGSFSGSGAGLIALNASSLSNGTVSLARLSGITSNQLDAGTWQLATNLNGGNAAALGGLTAANFWQLGGNSVTGGQFIGSTNYQPVEIWVNGVPALQVIPTFNDGSHSNMVNLVGGAPVNYIPPGAYGSVIAGGGAMGYFGLASSNSVSADVSFLGGGLNNSIQASASQSFLGGGNGNSIQANGSVLGGGLNNSIQSSASQSFLGGGYNNFIQTGAYNSFLGDGDGNSIQSSANESVLVGGQNNSIQSSASQSFLGGGQNNAIQTNSPGSVLVGGDFNAIQTNANYSFLGGGQINSIQANASQSFLGGGYDNSIQMGAYNSFLGGGNNNSIQTNSNSSVIVGGGANFIRAGAIGSFIGGGGGNSIQTNAPGSVLSGGLENSVGGTYATIPGGFKNVANGDYSFAAGYNAVATTSGSFVWADGNPYAFNPFSQSGPQGIANSFNVRSTGGFYIVTGVNSSGGITAGAYVAPGGTSWAILSDRNAKKNFAPVDGQAVLARLAAIPIEQWNYKWESDTGAPNIGPMAQDFKAAFYPGRDDKSISTLEFDGVELAAIQGLNQKLNSKDVEIQELKKQNNSLEKRLGELEQMVQSIAEGK